MRIGLPAEIKPDERRVAMVPSRVAQLTQSGHQVRVQSGAGVGAGFPDALYSDAGADLWDDPASVWDDSELVVKVKEPVPAEFERLRDDLVLFTYLHLAADRPLTQALLSAGTTAIAYETVTDAAGRLPLLAPMSEVAGRLATLAGVHHLQAPHGGPGVLAGGVPGVAPARVVIVGGGVVGTQAARMARGLQADVTVFDRSLDRVRALDDLFDGTVRVLAPEADVLADALTGADLIVGAVLVPGASAPQVLCHGDLKRLRPGCVLVDVAIDQGGCFETSHPTTHARPIYEVDGIVHYAVANMPGAVPVTSTRALANATGGLVQRLADETVRRSLSEHPGLRAGLTTDGGCITQLAVAAEFPDLPSSVVVAA